MNEEGSTPSSADSRREIPSDLVAVLVFVGLANLAIFLPVVSDSPVRIVLALPFVLFVPGYVFMAILFPEASSPEKRGADSRVDIDDDATIPLPTSDRGIDGFERGTLSFGASIAVVTVLGLALNYTSWGIRLVPIVVTLSGFTIAATVVAAWRRWQLPVDEQFRVSFRSWIGVGFRGLVDPPSRTDVVLNVVLVLAVVVAVTSVVYAVAGPSQSQPFTEFYVLDENGNGTLVADDYPKTLTVGEPTSLYVGIMNNEYETVEYTVVVQIQRVDGDENLSNVTAREPVDTFSVTLAHNETWLGERNLTVSDELTGEDHRLAFLLYSGDVPAAPTEETAVDELHLWVDVRGRA